MTFSKAYGNTSSPSEVFSNGFLNLLESFQPLPKPLHLEKRKNSPTSSIPPAESVITDRCTIQEVQGYSYDTLHAFSSLTFADSADFDREVTFLAEAPADLIFLWSLKSTPPTRTGPNDGALEEYGE